MNDYPFLSQSTSTSALVIDLDAITKNYRFLSKLLKKKTICSAIIKANAYGLGIPSIVKRLHQEGCQHFFVAQMNEGIEAKIYAPNAFVYVLNGIRKEDTALYQQHQLIPVLNSIDQILIWNQFAEKQNIFLPAILHFDTGINRTGLSPKEIYNLALNHLSHIEVHFLMSHLACAYQPDHPMNRQQLSLFQELCHNFPSLRRCFANSGGIFLGHDFHFDMVRPGLALYGLGLGENSFLKPCVHLFGQIIQIETINIGDSVGYDATYVASKETRVATIGLGYADGYPRNLSHKGYVYLNGYTAPIIGRISMDLITVDVTEIPLHLCYIGGWVEFFGNNISLDRIAHEAQTISWEMLTKLGHRSDRFYIDNNEIYPSKKGN